VKGKGLSHVGDGKRLVNEQACNSRRSSVWKSPLHNVIEIAHENRSVDQDRTISLRIYALHVTYVLSEILEAGLAATRSPLITAVPKDCGAAN
jgi:hypothetical protein